MQSRPRAVAARRRVMMAVFFGFIFAYAAYLMWRMVDLRRRHAHAGDRTQAVNLMPDTRQGATLRVAVESISNSSTQTPQPLTTGKTSEAEFTVVVTVSHGFDDMFRNWLYWFWQTGVRTRLVVFAEDQTTYLKYKDCNNFIVKQVTNDSAGDAFSYNTKAYNKLVSRRPRILLNAMHEYGNVLYSDIDLVWKQSPFPWLVGDHDLWALDDRRREDVCTGFIGMRKSSVVVSLLAAWAEFQEMSQGLNQQHFNKLLRSFRGSVHHLSMLQFANGYDYFENKTKYDESAIVVIHNNWIVGKDNKRQRFVDRNLWQPLTLRPCEAGAAKASSLTHADVRGVLVVMTMDRYASLARLLQSLAAAFYDAHVVDLHIWIDVIEDGARADARVLRLCQDFVWVHGEKRVHIHAKKAGLRGQWLETWRPSLSDAVWRARTPVLVLLEDDVEVSPFYWRWLYLGHQAYAHRLDITGFSLGRLNQCPKFCSSLNGGAVPDDTNFLHPWTGSTGFSPTLRHWTNFTAWALEFQTREHVEKPYVPGTRPTQWYQQFEKQGRCPGRNCMWSQLHHYYTMRAPDRNTVRAKCAGGLALAINHQERGLHYSAKLKPDAALLVGTFPERLAHFPVDPVVIGLDGRVSGNASLEM